MNDQSNEELTADEQQPHDSKPMFHFWRCFWLLFLVCSLGYAAYCFYVPSNQVAWAADLDSAKRRSIESEKPLVMYFTGQWCVPCRVMKRQVWADQDVTALVNQEFVALEIDVDDQETAHLVDQYDVGTTPVTIVTDSLGNVLDWRAGGLGKAEFLEFLQQVDHPAESGTPTR